ncbi:MAG: Rv1681 family radical SAM protein [Acetobacteraceae bacterium]
MPPEMEIELEAGTKTFADGLLPALIAALQKTRPGGLFAVIGSEARIGADLDAWCRFTRNSMIEKRTDGARIRWLIRRGEAVVSSDAARPIGSRLWLYTNFDCNLCCDYCCVRSSPKAARRALGLTRVRRIAAEAVGLGVGEIFVTGGEPFMLPDIGEILAACAEAAPTTVLTNGMLLAGRRGDALRLLPHDRLTFQISLDSPTPERHDRHRGRGSWVRAVKGIDRVRAEGFRARLAATVSDDAEADAFRRFLDEKEIPAEDRVIRRIVLRGAATEGVALARADLVPEVTITAEGVYWHPVGAEDADLLVRSEIFPLAESIAAVRRAFAEESAHQRRLARIFNCA